MHSHTAGAGDSISRGGESLAHLLGDAAIVNSNLYGEHGTPEFSFESLMLGCKYYSSEFDSGGDLFALILISTLGSPFYLAWRLLKDSTLSALNQIEEGVNDTYLSLDEQIDTADNRHSIAKTVGFPGLAAGVVARTAIYGGGLLGLSSFGFHQAASAFKNCVNFITDAGLATADHEAHLNEPRGYIATTLKHVNLVHVTNGLGYSITAACAVLGLTVHSLRAMRRGINAVSQAAFSADTFSIDAAERTAYDNAAVGSKEWFARAGLLGLAGIALGTVAVGIAKTLVLLARFLGFSSYSGNTISLAFKRCGNFIFDADSDLAPEERAKAAHKAKDPQTLEDRADRSWLGLNRSLNGFVYTVSAACGILGFSAHSWRAMRRGLNVVNQAAFETDAFTIDVAERNAYDKAAPGSKEWFARAGLLGLAGIAIGTVIIGVGKTLAKLLSLACSVLGFTTASMQAMRRGLNVVSQAIFGDDLVYIDRHERNAYDRTVVGSREWFERGGLLGLAGLALGTIAMGVAKLFVYVGRFLGFSEYGGNTVSRALKRCANFIFDADLSLRPEEREIAAHKAKDPQTLEDRLDRSWLGLNRFFNGFAYAVSFACGVLGFTVHSDRAMRRAVNALNQAAFGEDVYYISQAERDAYDQATLGSKEWFARAGLLGLYRITRDALWIGITKVVTLLARFLGFSEYGANTISRAFKRCANFIFDAECSTREEDWDIAAHKAKDPQTWEDRADRSWLGLNRILNGFAYSVSFACGVLGLTVHSLRTLRRGLNIVNQAVTGTDIFTIENEERAAYDRAETGSKEWFARAGIFGLAGLAIGAVGIGLSESGIMLGRFLGFSNYGANTVSLAFKRCANFIFDAEYDPRPEEAALAAHDAIPNPTLEERADRSLLGLNRVLNGFAYTISFACGTLGLTVHSLRAFRRGMNALSQAAFGGDSFTIDRDERAAYDRAETGSKEWFARAGLLGLAGLALGAVAIAVAKTLVLLGRFLGFSEYGANTISRAFKRCANFIFDVGYSTREEDEAIAAHKAKDPQTWEDRADRSWFGLNRVLNGFAYTVSFACGVLGLTVHSLRALRRGLNVVSQGVFGAPLFTIDDQEREAYDRTVPGSKEWFARPGIIGLAGIAIGTVIMAVGKLLFSIGRFLGISEYGGNTISRAFKNCSNFVFGTEYSVAEEEREIAAHKAKDPQTLDDRLDRSWFGLNRVLNGFAYTVSFACGVLGLTAHALRSMRRGLNVVSQAAFGAPLFTIADEERDAYERATPGSKEWFARAGILGLSGLALGTVALSIAKTLTLLGRFLGFSAYSSNTLSRAFKRCSNFIFGSQYSIADEEREIAEHKATDPQTLEARADRSWFGLNRILNGFAYTVSFACGVLGLSVHALRALRRGLNAVNQLAFGTDLFTISDEERAAYEAASPGDKEWFARAGLLGLAGLAIGTLVIAITKVLNLISRFLGFSAYSGNTISLAFKRCSNFVFGTDFNTAEEEQALEAHAANPNPSLADRADRSWFGINRLLNGFAYAVSAVLGLSGLSAANYHRAARSLKIINNIAADDAGEVSTASHDAFLNKMDNQNWFTYLSSRFNLLRVGAGLMVNSLWAAAGAFAFTVRRVWKLSLGNFIGNACGTDGSFYSSSSGSNTLPADNTEQINQHFRDLLWSLEPTGDLPAGKTHTQAIQDSKLMGTMEKITWRFHYELRKCASVFSLDSVSEKVILSFASAFQHYVRQEKRNGHFNEARLAQGFFGAKFDETITHIQNHYNKQRDKEAVAETARAIRDDIIVAVP